MNPVLRTVSALALLSACGGAFTPLEEETPLSDAGADVTASTVDDASIGNGVPLFDGGAANDAGVLPLFDGGGAIDALCTVEDDAGFVEAQHGKFPTLVYGGGPILSNPKLVTITFNDTFAAAQLQAMGATLTQTEWFAALTKEYCVPNGAPCITGGTAGESIAIDASAAELDWFDSLSDDAGAPISEGAVSLSSYLLNAITAATGAGPDPDAIYMVYLSPNASLRDMSPNLDKLPSCDIPLVGPPGLGDPDIFPWVAYHRRVASLPDGGGVPWVYAVIEGCGPTVLDEDGGAPTLLNDLTLVATQQFVEAVTDPEPPTGWHVDQDTHALGAGLPSAHQIRDQAWIDLDAFADVRGDCDPVDFALNTPSGMPWTLDSGVWAQRIWSPSEAAGARNPCIPVPGGDTYFNVSADQSVYVVAVGESFTITATAFSSEPRAGWDLSMADRTPTAGATLSYLRFEIDGAEVTPWVQIPCVNNGTELQIKVTLLADPATIPASFGSYTQGAWPQAEGWLLSSDVNAPGSPSHIWPFSVVTPAIAASIGLSNAGLSASAN